MKSFLFISLLSAGCAGEATARVEVPPLTIAAPPSEPAAAAPPVEARFVDATAVPASIAVGAYHQVFVAAVKGSVVAGGQTLSPGDVVTTTSGPVDVRGDGVAVVADAAVTPCHVPPRLVLASAAPDVAFLGGAMHARLDFDDRAAAPTVYLGRLTGMGTVPEHVHDKSWEVFCAVEAAGTFVIGGQPQRMASRMCVSVPPGTKHAWLPDAGSTLTAVQLYAPPGPEQRFKKMAAEPAK